ncbi:hypothetical protein HYH02_010918 [Chlamydomonas schloesseri]|uniref:Sugar phosphate transporter domain-containing protein n=1 Tax=Chlamydomonas schloesseri TaxID=2026947 RepID=A0A835TH76_9CHLO|nr:hypothetical protein HYH02_010918 [Chlamydomonas schloesseri]|eukprot:KAG2438216.1 hypothetical protein HYH02_010918 [Chlamydomonas schloesseri]
MLLQRSGVTSQLAASLEEGGRRDLNEPLLGSPARDASKAGGHGHGLVGLQRGGVGSLQPRAVGQLAVRLVRSRLGLQLLTVAACLSWMSASSWAILVNKHIMVNLKFAYPCTIAWMGLATTTLASLAALHAARLLPRHVRLELGFAPQHGGSSSSSSSSSSSGALAALAAGVGGVGGGAWGVGLLGVGRGVSWRYYATRVLPTGFFMALTFTTGNMGYLYLTVAFVQMLKAFCPVVTMLLLFVARLEAPSGRLCTAVGLIALGVALASYGELNLNLFGLTAMLVSVMAESVRLVLTQYLLAAGSAPLHPLEGLFLISSACTAVLAGQAALTEWPRLGAGGHLGLIRQHPGSFAAAACCGFLVNMLAITVIKLASSLTLKVLGTVKDAALVTIGIVFLKEHVTWLQLVGYSVSMVGFAAYNAIKAQQQQQQQHLGIGSSVGVAGGGGGGGGGGKDGAGTGGLGLGGSLGAGGGKGAGLGLGGPGAGGEVMVAGLVGGGKGNGLLLLPLYNGSDAKGK